MSQAVITQTLITFIVPILEDGREDLETALNNVGPRFRQNSFLPFDDVPGLHFASLSISKDEDGQKSDYLVFEINFDGPTLPFLSVLWNHCKRGIHDIFSCCEGYPPSGAQGEVVDYLYKHRQQPSAWHIGNVGRSVQQIKDEFDLRVAIGKYLDGLGQAAKSRTEALLYDDIKAFVENDPNLKWALQPTTSQTWWQKNAPRLKLWGTLALAVIVTIRFWKVSIPAIALVLALLRLHEKRDAAAAAAQPVIREDPAHIRELEKDEDFIGQNHLASLIRVKPGLFRRGLLRLFLFVVNLRARTSTDGKLGGIPSIHFAHWSLVDGGKRLMFLSNYDNSWNSYLDDFTDKASRGLTGIWSNSRQFPHTQFLLNDGASDGVAFKIWARGAQSRTRVWYSAYPHLSVGNIQRNTQIREGLSRDLQGEELTLWLRLF